MSPLSPLLLINWWHHWASRCGAHFHSPGNLHGLCNDNHKSLSKQLWEQKYQGFAWGLQNLSSERLRNLFWTYTFIIHSTDINRAPTGLGLCALVAVDKCGLLICLWFDTYFLMVRHVPSNVIDSPWVKKGSQTWSPPSRTLSLENRPSPAPGRRNVFCPFASGGSRMTRVKSENRCLVFLFSPRPDVFSTLLFSSQCHRRPVPVACLTWAPLPGKIGSETRDALVANWTGKRRRHNSGYFFSAPSWSQYCASGRGCGTLWTGARPGSPPPKFRVGPLQSSSFIWLQEPCFPFVLWPWDGLPPAYSLVVLP